MEKRERINLIEEELSELTMNILLDLQMDKKTNDEDISKLNELLEELKHLTYKEKYLKKSLSYLLYDLDSSIRNEINRSGNTKDKEYLIEIYIPIQDKIDLIFSDTLYELSEQSKSNKSHH